MIFFLISFVAGVLTVLAPCVLPLLPVIIGGSISDARSRAKPYVIAVSLSVSIFIFTILLKVLTIFIDIPQFVWQWISGSIIMFFGIITLFPDLWEKGAIKLNLFVSRKSNTALATGVKKESFWGDVIIGASLGPVFSSCSPTYFVILASVLPQSFGKGILDLVAYSIGLSLSLLLISILGQRIVSKLSSASDPRGAFKRSLGALFLVVGFFVFTGISRDIEAKLIGSGLYDITQIESKLLQKEKMPMPKVFVDSLEKGLRYPKYAEITNPSGFINSAPFKISDLIGKKVILLDFMTYSCINCQRTFPYLTAWYGKYKDEGLEIIAIHTPEFAFEKNIENVKQAVKDAGFTFPVVLDNDYGTWNAYGNEYWPHKYLIDIDGFVRYDHIGEGGYDETEEEIKSLLAERAEKLNLNLDTDGSISSSITPSSVDTGSRETYFGAFRNAKFFGNGNGGQIYEGDFSLPQNISDNQFYLKGKWGIFDQYIESEGDAMLEFAYNSKNVYLVAEGPGGKKVMVQNGENGAKSNLDIEPATLYPIIKNPSRQKDVFYIYVPKGTRLYSLTFG